jgi:hypothetical protein
LLLALLTHAGAHLALAIGFARKREWRRAALGFVLPPLAPLYGWRAGMRAATYAWTATLAVYALGVAAAGY